MSVFAATVLLSYSLACSAGEKVLNLPKANKGSIIKMEIDMAKERDLQAAVSQGHQPWRLDPVDVAFSEAANDPKVTYESCSLVNQNPLDAEVKCTGTHIYFIQLKRLLTPDGIWTVISIRVE
jgi:hypothetical protein